MFAGARFSARLTRLTLVGVASVGLVGCVSNRTSTPRPPSPTQSARSASKVLIPAGFAAGNRWTAFRDAHAVGYRRHAGFEIRALAPFAGLNNAVWLPGFASPVTAVTTAVTVRQLTTGGGYELLALECLHDPAGDGFAAGIDPARGTYSFDRLTPSGTEFARGHSKVLHGVRAPNRIAFTCSRGSIPGTTLLTLVANGNFIGQRTVSNGYDSFGDVAVALESDKGGTSGVFTDLSSRRP
jgi:hypothetical protein